MSGKKPVKKKPLTSKQKPTKSTPKKSTPAGPARPVRPAGSRAQKKKPVTSGRSDAEKARRTGAVTLAAGAAGAAMAVSEETSAQLDELQSTFNGLQESMLLTRVQEEMSEIETALSLLPTEIESLRTRGYVFGSFLEKKVSVLAEQWEEMRDRITREISRRTRELEQESDEAETALQQAMSSKRASHIARAQSAVSSLDSKVGAAHSSVEAMYENVQQNVHQTKRQVEKIQRLLDQIDEASFQLYPAEDPVAACEAEYIERGEELKGLLFLTDERLIFERKEDVATKKFLFITTEKETVQELIFEVSIGQVDEAKASDEGFLGRKEMLELLFSPEADLSGATLRLHGAENEEWAGLIGRVKSGEIAKERMSPKDEAVVEAAQAAPTKCPTCGATLSVEIVRGMREITCEYCGSVIRL